MNRRIPYPNRSTGVVRGRNGVTLTEVLMSLMIMGIGVVSLATLFPIATLRVLEATNLTNSTIARYNAEGVVDAFPAIIHEPAGIGNGQALGRNYMVDPLGWWEHESQLGLTAIDDSNLIYFEYNRNTGLLTVPPLTTPAGNYQTRFFGEDPTAGNRVLFSTMDVTRSIVSLPDTTTDYGEGFPDPDGSVVGAYDLNGDGRIQGLVLPAEIDMTEFTLAPGDSRYQNTSHYQAVIFDKSGDHSEIRQLTTVTSAGGGQFKITWEQDRNNSGSIDPGEELPLPLIFSQDSAGNPNVGLVRIEQPLPYYSWMLSVRKRISGPTNVDVVVFNKRDFSKLSEQVYFGDLRKFDLGPDGGPGMVGIDDNGDGNVDDAGEAGYPRDPPRNISDDFENNKVTISWLSDPFDPTSTVLEKPPLKKGGYILDHVNLLWYRIRAIESGDINQDGVTEDTSATLILETTINRNNTEDISGDGTLGDLLGEDLDGNNRLDRGGIIVLPGVIAVFPLETKIQ